MRTRIFFILILLLFSLFSNMLIPMRASIETNVVIYGDKYCESCLEYMTKLENALKNIGITDIQIVDFGADPFGREYLNELNDRLGVPYNMRGNVAVVIEDKYLFENYVLEDVVIDFILKHKKDYQSLVVFRDTSRDLYMIMDDKGEVRECHMIGSIRECLPDSNLNPIYKSIKTNAPILGGGIIIIFIVLILLVLRLRKKQS